MVAIRTALRWFTVSRVTALTGVVLALCALGTFIAIYVVGDNSDNGAPGGSVTVKDNHGSINIGFPAARPSASGQAIGNKPKDTPDTCPAVPGSASKTAKFFVQTLAKIRTDDCWLDTLTVPTTPVTARILIVYKNVSHSVEQHVIFRANLAPGLSLIPDAEYLYDGSHPNGVQLHSNTIDEGGVDAGAFAPNAVGYVTFEVKTPFIDDLKCGTNRYTTVGIAHAQKRDEFYNVVNFILTKSCTAKSSGK